MNANAKKWIEALRSGEYKQAKGWLKTSNGEETRYCCLGVACEISKEELNLSDTISRKNGIHSFNDNETVLPSEVKNWLGLTTNNGIYNGHFIYEENAKSLTKDNDSGKCDFNCIADIIEQNAGILFKESK